MAGKYIYNKKWRAHNRDLRNREKARNYEKGAIHQANAYAQWTKQECSRITNPGRPNDRVLARELGRTVQAIQAQRWALKKKGESPPIT